MCNLIMIYNVYTLTIEQLHDLIASGDDSHDNQIRITTNGDIFLSDIVGAEHLDGIAGRFESFDAGNSYVGAEAAADQKFIKRLFDAIQHWKEFPCTYIDTF